jgi:hypothetical protein
MGGTVVRAVGGSWRMLEVACSGGEICLILLP